MRYRGGSPVRQAVIRTVRAAMADKKPFISLGLSRMAPDAPDDEFRRRSS
jgi:hypothetical protein